MITALPTEHGMVINDLAERGKIKPVSFVTPDGIVHDANSVWAATDWLKINGHYENHSLILWRLQ